MTWLTRLLWLTLPITLGDLLASVARGAQRRGRAGGDRAGVGPVGRRPARQPRRARRGRCWSCALVMPLAVVGGAGRRGRRSPRRARLGRPGDRGGRRGRRDVRRGRLRVHQRRRLRRRGDGSRCDRRRRCCSGPIGLVWALTALPLPVAVLALAAQQWVLRRRCSRCSGAAAAWWGVRVLARLTRRWCVFVPAGITLVDDMALAEPTLMRARRHRGDRAGAGGHDRAGPDRWRQRADRADRPERRRRLRACSAPRWASPRRSPRRRC